VYEPRSWPKNSLPESVGTMVVQSATTSSGLSGRASSAWTSRATSSLPVPLSPVIRIGASVKRAASTTWRNTARQAGL
jgi:hypothetical protein